MQPMIDVSHVSKRYQVGAIHHRLSDVLPTLFRRRGGSSKTETEFWALKDVSFQVRKGETLGIIGRNGAGKSTMLKLLSGISKQTEGQIAVRGKLAALIEVGAGFHPDLTGRENVFLNGAILGLKRREIRALFDQIVGFAEVERFIDTPVKRYSSGMYVRLGFAIAVHIQPEILLIDEVLSVGDMAFQQKCLQRIQELKQAGTTMIFISHNINAVQRICDRAVLLRDGRLVAEGMVENVLQAYREEATKQERDRSFQTRQGQRVLLPETGVRIEAVRLRNEHGEAAEVIATGSPMTLEVAYACSRPVARPMVTVTLDRLDGLLCHVASMNGAHFAGQPLDGRGVIRLHYPSLQLLPHTYRVSVDVREEGGLTLLDSRKHAVFFTTTSDSGELGAVHLDHQWEWNGGMSPDEA